MKITIDTKVDSAEVIHKVIRLLKEISTDKEMPRFRGTSNTEEKKRYQNMFRDDPSPINDSKIETNNANSAPSQNPFTAMFGSEAVTQEATEKIEKILSGKDEKEEKIPKEILDQVRIIDY